MESSDDELEIMPEVVSDYYFEDEDREPISFSLLPLRWGEEEMLKGERERIFLCASFDRGLQKFYKPVTAWKMDLSEPKPGISVLFKETNWIKLEKPRKGYEDEIRSILVTINCLHLFKKDPETSEKPIWDQLAKTLGSYEDVPCQDDLIDHMSLVGEAVKRDQTLGESKFLLSFLEEKPQKRKEFDKVNRAITKPAFIVEDNEIEDVNKASDDDEDPYKSVCVICDNGGDLLCCDGECMRSFHATKEAGADSECESLGFTSSAEVDAISNYYCKNCQYKQQQCFSCGKLGSSDKAASAEVFRCVNATCGLFYHPHCVAKLLHRDDEAAAQETKEKIAAGELFTCPAHKCHVCKSNENKDVRELQFAMCRRCPRSYHRKCLPRKIVFEDIEEEGIIQRAWEDLLPFGRILIYCLKHEIDDDLGTPLRNHLRFPASPENMSKQVPKSLREKGRFGFMKRSPDLEVSVRQRTAFNQVEMPSSCLTEVDRIKRNENRIVSNLPKKIKASSASAKPLNSNTKSLSKKSEKASRADENGPSLGEQLYGLYCSGSEPNKSGRRGSPSVASDNNMSAKAVKGSSKSVFRLDADSETRILDMMEETKSSITMENIVQKRKVPSTHVYYSKNTGEKIISQGRVDGFIEALQAAGQKLKNGCSIEDVKAVCEPEVLYQMVRSKNKLKVYLAPFLYGMRYTSFGRHFTKVDKLKEIVDKLHWYVKNGDMIVDFCCGANDFSCLMKNKLEETGKKCFYKNYDVLQPKHDFNFEKRDWMTVQPKELPTGSQLIMGLNPPFGVKAALANQFINKALEFKPKLIILIVPPETERLDKKRSPYDLIWEDDMKLSGKSFYLPGSIDANDKYLEQWNLVPPLLSLWSRPDWVNKHRSIAQKHGHFSRVREESHLEGNQVEIQPLGNPVEKNSNHLDDSFMIPDVPMEVDESELEDSRPVATCQKERPCIQESHESQNHGENQSSKKLRKRRRGRGHGNAELDVSGRVKANGGKPLGSEMMTEATHQSPHDEIVGRSSSEGRPSEPHEVPSHLGFGDASFQHFQPEMATSERQYGRGYGGGPDNPDDPTRWYSQNSTEPMPNGMSMWPNGPATGYNGYKSYSSESDDFRSTARYYGHQDPSPFSQRGSYTAGHDPGFSHVGSLSSYGHLGSPMESSFNRLSGPVMQRYAPRLDELNHTRMSTSGPRHPMESENDGMYDPLAPRARYRADPRGFAPGPQYPFTYHGSSGWLNE